MARLSPNWAGLEKKTAGSQARLNFCTTSATRLKVSVNVASRPCGVRVQASNAHELIERSKQARASIERACADASASDGAWMP